MEIAAEAAARRNHPLVRAAGTLSEVADQPQLAAVCCLVLAAGLLRGDGRLMRTGARMLAAHALAAGAKSWVKHSVKRTRPYVLLDEGRYERRKGGARESREASFPSGHTAGAFAVATALVPDYPAAWLPAYGTAAAIAAVQVPRGKHYPADLAAGLVIGLAAGCAANLACSLLERVGRELG